MMAKFRKKPIIIEAEQFWPDKQPWPKGVYSTVIKHTVIHYVITIHGQQTNIIAGDWIISENKKDLAYPCKPDIFEKTYEKIND